MNILGVPIPNSMKVTKDNRVILYVIHLSHFVDVSLPFYFFTRANLRNDWQCHISKVGYKCGV
jgi:hypothetical protein